MKDCYKCGRMKKNYSIGKITVNEVESIIQELGVPLKTFRIFAIEKAIRAGKSPELLKALKDCLVRETDAECRLLLEHAISSIEERLDSFGQKSNALEHEKILHQFSSLSPSQQLAFVKNTSRNYFCADNSDVRIKRIIDTASNPVVIAELINKCRNSWPVSLMMYLEENLFCESPVLQLACLEAAVQHSPEVVQRNFEKLVLSSDPLLRALAIRGLARSFPESAAEFLADCLRKGDFYGRLAALRVCSVMQFDLIKSSILELLFAEQDERLLKIAAAIIMSNPDREIPFRLCEMLARQPSGRKKFFQDLIRKSCEIIKIAEACEDFPQYLATVQKYNQNVRARFLLLELANSYAEADESTKRQIAEVFKEKSSQKEFQDAIIDLQKKQPGILKELVAASAQSGSQANTDKEKEAEKPNAVVGAAVHTDASSAPTEKTDESPESLLQDLIRCQTGKSENTHEKIKKAFAFQSPELVSAALRAAVAVNDNRWISRAKSLVKSENENLCAASFEYLAKNDPDSFLLLLRGFINSSSLLVRTTLLRSVCRISSEVARELLTSMLNDSSPTTRERAIGSLIHFEFASIRSIVSDYLCTESNSELISSCLSFYLANPLLESVYDLKQLEERRQFAQLFKETRESLSRVLEELNIANAEEIHQFLQQKESKSAAQSQQPAANHEQKRKLDSIKSRVKWDRQKEKPIESGIKLQAYLPLLLKFGLPVLLVVAFAIYFSGQGSDNTANKRQAVNTVPLAGKVQDFVLIVQKIDSIDGALIGLDSQKKFIRAMPRPGKLFLIDPGDKVRIKALPFKVAPDGTLIVKTISIKKEN